MEQLQLSGDRLDICALDGNAKLHRRTCGQPFAEVLHCHIVNKYLLRHCSRTPCRKETLCHEHAAQKNCQPAERFQIGRHRLKRALHSEGDVQHLEIQMEGFGSWQPACTVPAAQLENYFANLADAEIRRRWGGCFQIQAQAEFLRPTNLARRQQRAVNRQQNWHGMRPRRNAVLAQWSSQHARAQCTCQTHKETEQHITAASKSAGFLFAVSAGGRD